MKEEKLAVRESLPDRRTNVTTRFTDTEKHELKARAAAWSNGNVAAWIRYASLRLRPDDADLVAISRFT